jgi:hypothetical protein
MVERTYALERLYEDQEPDLVADTIPATLAWFAGPREDDSLSHAIDVRRGMGRTPVHNETLVLSWDEQALERRGAGTLERARRMRSKRTADREHVTQLAAYGLALVGLSVWMPGRRAITFREGLPPDILFDVTDGAVRGVEVAGRETGGFGALRIVLEGSKAQPGGKRAQLIARSDVAEAHVSLWCVTPRVSMQIKVKP